MINELTRCHDQANDQDKSSTSFLEDIICSPGKNDNCRATIMALQKMIEDWNFMTPDRCIIFLRNMLPRDLEYILRELSELQSNLRTARTDFVYLLREYDPHGFERLRKNYHYSEAIKRLEREESELISEFPPEGSELISEFPAEKSKQDLSKVIVDFATAIIEGSK